VRGPGRGPAAEEDVDADGQVDQADDAGELLQAAVGGDGNDETGVSRKMRRRMMLYSALP
jgi:hypothetical protein